jgi:transcriptional regulator with XRE-family HTH domain
LSTALLKTFPASAMMDGMTLEEARKRAHLSKEGMARELGVSTRTIYNYERGRTPVTPMVIYAYAGVTGVDPDELQAERVTARYSHSPHTTSPSRRHLLTLGKVA